ncbi:gpi-anchor transamidase-like protein [Podospora appendiculata]|uniref:Gpi-anchor transamidase-like protein n=1 Tax=Podospora appendiculata TaxID=314037 RepID=A0AAE0X8X6_9PEZI|nr:gpi-anchor transamidase-like protein [Podospora appendiculata]
MKLSSVLRLPALLAMTLLAPAAVVEAEHTSNWAVLVSTSRFWFNYRHLANVLSMYRTVKRLGIPDSQIILMLPDDMACNPRNAFPGTVYSNADRAVDLYGDNIEVDYRGYEVTVENFIRLLTDRVGDEMPRSKRLLTDDRSNILVYMTGHGGNEFLKFQDNEEIGAFDLADAFEQMWEKKRYHEILFMIDTCQANTMYSKLYSPNIIATGSSKLDESSYSHHADNDVGVAVIDRYTYYNLEFLETEVRDTNSKKTVGDLFDSYTYEKIHSNTGVRYDLFRGGAEAARSRLVTDFFGNVQNVEVDGSKNTTLEEDLLSLSRTIAALQRIAAEEEKAASANTTDSANSKPVAQRKPAVAQKKSQFAKPLTDDNWWTKKAVGATFLPLREITLNSRPLIKRALAFSCDGELAVAADDSVHVFVPEFPDLSKRKEKQSKDHRNGATNGDHHDEEELSSDAADNDDDGAKEGDKFVNYGDNTRAQFSEGSKHMPVSYPPLDPRVNKELFTAAGLPFPYEYAGNGAGPEPASDDEVGDSEMDDSEDDNNDNIGSAANRPFGAGYGPITGVGSSMNHVVCMGWSPSGLGVNRRPILAVMTGAGTIAMYGDGSTAVNILHRANDGMLQHRELVSWMVLWGVGERLMVPGQQTEVSEYIRGFAWAKEVAIGQALLATINDLGEVAILSVQLAYTTDGARTKSAAPRQPDSAESLVWRVQEVARFKAKGPHPTGDIMDPDWAPCGTSFGLTFSPWFENEDSRVCVLSFVDKNYVGFRRITIKKPWARGELPDIEVGSEDIFGNCLHLTTDAFVEFENALWNRLFSKVCRGVVSTGTVAMPFEIAIFGGSSYHQEPHSPKDCGTVYAHESVDSENPIVDMIIHPPDLSDPAPVPLYTLIRMSATAKNDEWYENNDPTATAKPQWARDISQKVEISVPADKYKKLSYDVDSDSDDGSGDSDGEEMDDDDDDGNDDGEIAATAQVPEIHPHRLRLYGLAISPGGGATAVLASAHNTQHPERGGWHTVRSTIYFGHQPRRRRTTTPDDDEDEDDECPHKSPPLTMEARLFDWLYGGGPEVPGVTTPARAEDSKEGARIVQERDRLAALFRPALERQTCDRCGTRMTAAAALSRCETGHFFGTCATSGLAVHRPGITRSCGTCGMRTMRTDVMISKVPEEMRGAVLREMRDGVCGQCGGKFLN